MGSELRPPSFYQAKQPHYYLSGVFRFKAIAIGFLGLLLLTSISWAGTISGPSGFCLTSSGYTATYTASGFTGATKYNWRVPSFVTILSGHNTATITVKFTDSTAPVALIYVDAIKGSNHVGSYGLVVNLYRPVGPAGAISGPSTVCAGQTNVEYSVSVIPNATQYSWILPNGASLASPNGSKIKVNFSSSFAGGTIRAFGIAGPCGTGTMSSYTISKVASPSTPGAISGKSLVATGETNVTYSIPAIANASNYQWTVPSGVTITSGQGTRTIKVNFSSAFQSGNIIVHGLNGGCVGPASAPLYVALSKLPGPVGSITRSSAPCVGTSGLIVTYSISPVTNENPLGYSWTLGPGMVPLGNPNLGGDPRTNVMRVRFLGNASVTTTSISVYNKNSYGSGPASTKNIRVYRPAATPAHIAGPINIAEDQVEATYSVSSIENASPHVWVVSEGITKIAGYNSNTLTVSFDPSFTEGEISVYGVSGPCGAGPTSSISIWRGHQVKTQPDKNYVVMRKVHEPNDVFGLSSRDVHLNVTYYDGLGRPIQNVSWQGSPLKKDIGH